MPNLLKLNDPVLAVCVYVPLIPIYIFVLSKYPETKYGVFAAIAAVGFTQALLRYTFGNEPFSVLIINDDAAL